MKPSERTKVTTAPELGIDHGRGRESNAGGSEGRKELAATTTAQRLPGLRGLVCGLWHDAIASHH